MKCWITALMAPITSAEPKSKSQKFAVRMAATNPIEEPATASRSTTPSGISRRSAGAERVTQKPIGNRTIRMSAPADCRAYLHPKLWIKKLAAGGATTPPTPSPR
jgi:hypothetical protein